MDLSKSLGDATICGVGLAGDAFERLRHIAFEGEHAERMAALGVRTKLSPGVLKTLMRLSREDAVSMGEMARAIGCDPSYVTALVDDLDDRGLARREPAPYDRRVKTVVLTDAGRALAAEINGVLSVPPAAFSALSNAELRQLRDLLDKIIAAGTGTGAGVRGRNGSWDRNGDRGGDRRGQGRERGRVPPGNGLVEPGRWRRRRNGPESRPRWARPRNRVWPMSATGGAAVTVERLSKSYGDTVAVRDVSFEVQRGEVFALLGPNGAGKTTTVEILEGFRGRSGGRVETLGVDPAERSTQRWLRTHIGVVLQELAIEPYYSVRQVLSRNAGFYPNPRPVDEVIELIGLGEKADDRVKRLSGGQQRRLDVGLGIIGNPSLLFLDEPTTGLDPSGRRDTWQLIRRLAESGTTVLLTTHYMDEVEVLADRVAVLFGQEIVAMGTPSSIGGRDVGAVTIRFVLPDGVSPDALPVPVVRIEGDGDHGDDGDGGDGGDGDGDGDGWQGSGDGRGATVEITTEDEVAVLHRLTGWALEGGHPLRGITVARVSLEDVYLSLTRDDEAAER